MYIKNWGVGESDGVSGERDEMGGGFCARPRDLKFCTHLCTYLLQVKFEVQVLTKRDKA